MARNGPNETGTQTSTGTQNRDNPVDAIDAETGHTGRGRAVGVNHVALEVGSVDEALRFYGSFLEFELRGRSDGAAFIDLGDQFIALVETTSAASKVDAQRHVGLVVEDKARMRAVLEAQGIDVPPGRFLDIHDPWGNRLQIVDYAEIQFTKAPSVLAAMGLSHLTKSDTALDELREKGVRIEAEMIWPTGDR